MTSTVSLADTLLFRTTAFDLNTNIEMERKNCNIEFAIKNSAFKDAANIDKKYRNEILRKAALIRYNDAADCCPNAGYVSAAPEEWRKVPGYVGNLDWAIIHNVCAAPSNTMDADKHTAALIPMAMIWGGNHHGTTISGFRDVTYATPIGAVLKDIECEMGWDEGSLRFC
ncbi:hypothetical protein BofuT4_P079120.1 [Botrytis cinerea T4]|uniref:Uncharacterized protein n=1 Tax=Botryotinia fuckeliana (strain T4) TaxID=999810 RepID=G2YL99_BOTF4|nr:hypothetical protein BofuT4_P079120.1 [Botrytis cinerea T4]